MAILGNVSGGVVDILTTDTIVLSTPSGSDRIASNASSLHNTTGGTVNVSFYESSDGTSAGGKRVEVVAVSANDTIDVNGLIGQGYSGAESIVAVADVVGSNIKFTYTKYSGES
jgi:hypothetical protein